MPAHGGPDPDEADDRRESEPEQGGTGRQPEHPHHVGHHRLVGVVDDAAAQPGVAVGQPAPEVEGRPRHAHRTAQGHPDRARRRDQERPPAPGQQQVQQENRRRQLDGGGQPGQHPLGQQPSRQHPRPRHQVQRHQGDQDDAQLPEPEGLHHRLHEEHAGAANQAQSPAGQPEAVQHRDQGQRADRGPDDLDQGRRQQRERHRQQGGERGIEEGQPTRQGVEVAPLEQHRPGQPVDVEVDHDRLPRDGRAPEEGRRADVEGDQHRRDRGGREA